MLLVTPPPLTGAQSDGTNPKLILKVDRCLGFSLDLLFPIVTSLLSCLQAARDSKIHSKTETRVQRDSSAKGVVPKSQTKSDKRVVM